MKLFRNSFGIADYMFNTYAKNQKSTCKNCQFQAELYKLIIDMNYTPIENTSYLESRDGKKITIDNIKKKCKYVCIVHY